MVLSDILSATSIILVFIILAFDKLSTTVENILETSAPDIVKVTELTKYRKILKVTLFKTLVIFTMLLIILYIFFPTTWGILCNSHIDVWKFNLLNTLFVIIELCISAMTIYVGVLVYKIFRKRNKSFHLPQKTNEK